MLLYILLSNDYKVKYVKYSTTHLNWYETNEIGERVRQLWHERYNPDNPYSEVLLKADILVDVKSMTEAKSFSDTTLQYMINRVIEAEKTYPLRVSEARWRAMRHFIVTLAVCIGVFGFGHGVFCLVVWIIRGFQDFQ